MTTSSRPKKQLEVAEIIRQHGQQYRESHSLTKKQQSVLSAIELCRTGKLGYHLDKCTHCEHTELINNSCRDRHCPKCQGISQRIWVQKRLKQLLPVPYYHVVFTLPPALFPLSLYNKRLIYNLLFDSAADTLKDFGRNPQWLGGKIGFYGILHTWGQTLWHHPHVHFIVAGGAIGSDGQWISPQHKGKFLFPVRALSKVFRGKFMSGLEKALKNGKVLSDNSEPEKCTRSTQIWLKKLVAKEWVVYCKSPFKKAEQVIRYIGRYTHKVAISNSRLVDISDDKVTFSYRDYKKSRVKNDTMKLKCEDFLERFLWHVLPEKFHRIRHFGFLANGKVEKTLSRQRAQKAEESTPQHIVEPVKVSCPNCDTGVMRITKILTATGFLIDCNPKIFSANGP